MTDLAFNLSWANPTWDVFIVLFFVVGAFVYGISLGRDRLVTMLVAIYMSLAVVDHAPFLSEISANINVEQIFVLRIGFFVGFFLFMFFLLSRSALQKTIAKADTIGDWWQIFVYSFLHVGLLISILLSFLPESRLSVFSKTTVNIFTSEMARFLWIVVPILAMIFVKGGASEKKKTEE